MSTNLKKMTPNLMVEDATKQATLKSLRQIPGVGKSIAEDLWNLGVRAIEDLKDQEPEDLYLRLCALQGTQVDRCMLYVFRCAVYYASHEVYDPELLKWWNWKDRRAVS
jgi:pathogenicity locus Cdd1 protein